MRSQGGRYVISGLAAVTLDGWASATVRARVAFFRSLAPSMDKGCTEWLLDGREFSYTVITNSDMQAGDLASRFDVILFAADHRGRHGRRWRARPR